ncbi:histidine phosphatase family protein [Cellulomonas sp. ATA003]|uniref:histidine phosphatase family protein n=1 Tax=Cellulomonas sp. ATA003 TaxID=3073064 RepID=UPI00287312B2|nr:histidine phosphatase family protein [Cellulomonas sp. ATA003]WNB85329.1 histidine phosphatase family protein [Cellulomonas sp. ATA003]
MGATGVSELLLVRHGESVGNTAARAAQAAGEEVIDVPARDPDVVLSPTGEEQARALGGWLGDLPPGDRPESVWASPYVRAAETARLALEVGGLPTAVVLDERLRDRELGVLDRLTAAGVDAQQPDEAERRRWVGKFYYRPPGGESWADLALRIRSLLADLDRYEDGRRVLLVCHDAVIMVIRYVCEGLTEEQVMAASRAAPVANASVTRLVRAPGERLWTADVVNAVGHLEARGATPTAQPGRTDVGD